MRPFLIFLLTISASTLQIYGQVLSCRVPAFAAYKPLPKLKYKCRETDGDYDEAILKFPERVAAIDRYRRGLETFNRTTWWSSSVDDLIYCDIHQKVGRLTKREIEKLKDFEYHPEMSGDGRIRIVQVSDPCYQSNYGGSNVFLLYRKGWKVVATEIIDGYYTRADFPLGLTVATLGTEKIIEIDTTSGGLNPTETKYYFAIDPRTGEARPKLLFKSDKGATHIVSSMMLLQDPQEYGLPASSEPLSIIKNGKLRQKFSSFDDLGEKGTDGQPKFTETVMHWNGKYYQ